MRAESLRIRVIYGGATDGMVPAKGHPWLKAQLEAAGLICTDVDAWKEVPEAGHDVRFLEEVVDDFLAWVES
ncbi:hypothetical protein FB451DRAFT_1392695 [Mycena latifolia]|nr:hypothetical protein FB451DRAFT_1392695 [Mycena latifolia]